VVELQKPGSGVESGKELEWKELVLVASADLLTVSDDLRHVRCLRSERQIFARRLDFINMPPAIPEFFTIWIICTRTAFGSIFQSRKSIDHCRFLLLLLNFVW
jgi:hypothetical protein